MKPPGVGRRSKYSLARLDCLVAAGLRLLFRQGVPLHASYLFKHALVQDAAYAPCCVSQDVRFTPELLKPLKASRGMPE